MPSLLLLGSTGSIGTQTLELVAQAAGAHRIEGLAARSSWQLLVEQARRHQPRFVALCDEAAAAEARSRLPASVHVLAGEDALAQIAREAEYDVAVHGVVGAAGLVASVEILRRGKTLALANKESLVLAGSELMRIARESGASIVPVDSEHSAVFQCLRGESIGRVRRIVLTASGGPFRTTARADLERVTPAMALKHPNWSMGPRITIGSATLMNKALEVIELHHLFDLEPERIEVVIHPQSIVHSLVEFVDGSVKAQLGPPDMRGPIHYALHHPDRAPSGLAGFDVDLFQNLTFEAPDRERFPALELGWRCVAEGADSGAVLNAADEVSVQAFLGGRIGFCDIARINRLVLDQRPGPGGDVASLLRSDGLARDLARQAVDSSSGTRGSARTLC